MWEVMVSSESEDSMRSDVEFVNLHATWASMALWRIANRNTDK